MIGWIASALERPLVIEEPFQHLDAIVVLGAPLGPGDRMTAVLEERVVAAAALWHAGGAPIVVATGGKTRDAGRAEADVIAEALAARGVPGAICESRSRTTDENARFTAELIAQRRIWLVTQPFHGRRAARVFRAAGFEPHVWHIADSIEYSDRKRAMKWLVREYGSWGRELLRARR
jgi:uncharacterized SAM-binding protein YcdF (DUF218 family)